MVLEIVFHYCSSNGNTLYQLEKHIVSANETKCFHYWNKYGTYWFIGI